MRYKYIASLIAWMFPTKEDRRAFRKFCKDIDDRIKNDKRNKVTHQRYSRVLKSLRKAYRKRKIKVCFICQDNAKWAYQSFYELLAEDEHFEPLILISITTDLLRPENAFLDYKKRLEDNYNFFAAKGMNVAYAFDIGTNEFVNLKIFKPDILFYEEPWALAKIHAPYKTAKYALNCHCSYGTSITNGTYEYTLPFYKHMWRFFLDNVFMQPKLLDNGFKLENVPVIGALKLDAYLQPIKNNPWKTADKKHIIWAPHHSFSAASILKYGTFDWNYQFMYEYAKNHQEYEFILKPHPVIYKEIVNRKLMSEAEMKQYFAAWRSLPNAQIIEGGNYFDVFKTSDLLITDCCSFLCEYLPTTKPIIQLINPKSVGYNEFGKQIISGNYKVYNLDELAQILNDILVCGKDDLKDTRLRIIEEFNLAKTSVAKGLIQHLENVLREK